MSGKKRARPCPPEYELQKECVRWLKQEDYLFFAAPADKFLHGLPREKGMALQIWRARGFSNGFPDLFVFQMGSGNRLHADLEVTKSSCPAPWKYGSVPLPVAGLGIELKIGRNPLTRYQESWRDALRGRGYAFVVVRNLNQLKAYVRLHHGQDRSCLTAEEMASISVAQRLD